MKSIFDEGLSKSLLGSQSLGTDISLGHQIVAVLPTDNIQEVVETLSAKGGGTLKLGAYTYNLNYSISLASGISLVGEGKDTTILDFGDTSNNLNAIGTSGSIMKNFSISNLTVQNSSATAGIDIDFADFWRVENVRVTSCDQKGIRINNSHDYLLINVQSNNNTGNGFEFICTDVNDHNRFLLINCLADTNGGIGFSFSTTTSAQLIRHFSLIRTISKSNTGDGFDFASSVLFSNSEGEIISCFADSNGGIGFDVASNVSDLGFVSCFAEGNTGDGFEIDGLNIRIIGCSGSSNGSDFDLNGTTRNEHLLLGNIISVAGDAHSSSGMDANLGQSYLNIGDSTKTARRLLRMENNTGGALAQGDVVVNNSPTNIEDITTTTTGGDQDVFGMVDGSIANTANGYVLIEGFTKFLKVNGTTDIAVGDYLCTFTSATIAQKATTTGQMVFAIALEAYATNDSNGVIDAYILPWRFPLP